MKKLENRWVFVVMLVIGTLLLAIPLQAGWATPSSSPLNQGTVPPEPEPKPQPGGGGSEAGATPPIPDVYSVGAIREQKLGPDGGKLDAGMKDGHCILVQVDPGKLKETVLFQVILADQKTTPPDTCDAAKVADRLCKTQVQYVVKAWHSTNGQEAAPNERFPFSYSQVICYTDADLALAADKNPDNLLIAYYDETAKKWEPVATKADKVNHNVGALVDHVSLWALMARPAGSTVQPEATPAVAG